MPPWYFYPLFPNFFMVFANDSHFLKISQNIFANLSKPCLGNLANSQNFAKFR